MKTLRLFIILAMSLASFHIKGQTIEPSSEWRVNFSIWEPGIQINYEFYRDFIEGDTIINSHSYSKIYKSGYGYIDWSPNPSYYYFSHVLHGFLREEDSKWYTVDANQDRLLYDFTLAVNDTVYSAFTYPFESPVIVTAIDSVLIGSVYKKRFHLNIQFGAEYIIEDVGATTGLFESMVLFEWDSKLVCFAENGVSVWADSTEECNLNVNIPETQAGSRSCTLYPNPAEEYTILSIPSNFTMAHIMLVDTFGRLLLNRSTGDDKSIKIPLSAFPVGIYLLIVENGDKRESLKLIIQ